MGDSNMGRTSESEVDNNTQQIGKINLLISPKQSRYVKRNAFKINEKSAWWV